MKINVPTSQNFVLCLHGYEYINYSIMHLFLRMMWKNGFFYLTYLSSNEKLVIRFDAIYYASQLRVVDREWALVLRHQISLPLTIWPR